MTSGRFVWYELLTTDPKAAVAFYTEVLGWKTEAFGEYTMFAASQGPLGGLNELPEAARAMGAVPYWQGNVVVANVDEAAAKVEQLGGKVYLREEVPEIGRFAVIADPYGAVLALYTPTGESKPRDRNQPGEIGWNELYTSDNGGAFEFYRQIVGWEKLGEQDVGAGATYLTFGLAGEELGGMMKNPVPPSWMYYVTTDDLDGVLERAKTRGATVLFGPMGIPGKRRVVALKDPQGAAFALITRIVPA
jgi:predicted enzyme related to lactoylglutathione lyase